MRQISGWTWCWGCIALVVMSGCSRPAPTLSAAGRQLARVAGYPGGPPGSPASEKAEPASDEPTEGTAKAATFTQLAEGQPDRYLIRNGTLSLEVKDARSAAAALVAGVRAMRGYVASSHETADGLGRRSVEMEVRVPAGRFERSLREVEALGKVLDRQITAEDVTEEFVDSQAKLRNLNRTEARLLEHLNRTGRLSDTLLVEKELSRVRGEIEQLEGRLRFLAHRVAYSTLTVTLSEAPRPQAIAPVETYSSGKEMADAVRSLVAFARVVWTGMIWLGVWAVVWLPLALAGCGVYRRQRRVVAG
jgi:hypothetical protein